MQRAHVTTGDVSDITLQRSKIKSTQTSRAATRVNPYVGWKITPIVECTRASKRKTKISLPLSLSSSGEEEGGGEEARRLRKRVKRVGYPWRAVEVTYFSKIRLLHVLLAFASFDNVEISSATLTRTWLTRGCRKARISLRYERGIEKDSLVEIVRVYPLQNFIQHSIRFPRFSSVSSDDDFYKDWIDFCSGRWIGLEGRVSSSKGGRWKVSLLKVWE